MTGGLPSPALPTDALDAQWVALDRAGIPFAQWPAAARQRYTAWNMANAAVAHPATGTLRYSNTGKGPALPAQHPTTQPTGGVSMSLGQDILGGIEGVAGLLTGNIPMAAQGAATVVQGIAGGGSAPAVQPVITLPPVASTYQQQVSALNAARQYAAATGTGTTSPGYTGGVTNPYVNYPTVGSPTEQGAQLTQVSSTGNPIVNALPSAGAVLGGILGDVPGAIVGGAAGEGAKALLDAIGGNNSKKGLMLMAQKPQVIGSRKDLNGQTRPIRRCPTGYVLAIDGNCYPRRVLPRALRKWKPAPRPAISHKQLRAVRTAEHLKKRLVELTKEAGGHASMTKPRSSSRRRDRE